MAERTATVVLQVVDALSRAGKERVAVNLANGLSSLGYSSHLLATRTLGPLAADLNPGVARWCGERRSRWDLPGLRRVARLIDSEGIEIVHSHNPSSSYLMRLALRLARRRPLHVVHDHRGPAAERLGVQFWDRLVLRRVDAWIGASQQISQHARDKLAVPAERCVFIANGIKLAPPWDQPAGPPTIAQVANLHRVKGHMTAVRAAARLRERIPDLQWLCIGRLNAGESGYVAEIRRAIRQLGLEDCFRLLGEQGDVHSLLREAQVGVLSSNAEGLPLALLEYWGAARPVVITDVGEGPELVRRAEAGRVVPPGQPDRLADAIEDTLADRQQALAMGQRGRVLVAREFDVDTMSRSVSGLYQRLLDSREDPATESR